MDGRRHDTDPGSRVVVVADWNLQVRQSMCREFGELGWLAYGCADTASVRDVLDERQIDLLVTELRLDDGPTLSLIERAQEQQPRALIAVATSHESVATVVKCMRLGVRAYLPKPTTAEDVLASISTPPLLAAAIPAEPMRLERATWEYMHRVLVHSGSITRASEVLGLDRRSLRRMLSRFAPP